MTTSYLTIGGESFNRSETAVTRPLVLTPENEMTKALTLIDNQPSGDAYTVNEANELVTTRDGFDEGGFYAAYFRKAGVRIEGLRSVPYRGGTLLSAFCSPDRVKKHYSATKYCKDAKAAVVIYASDLRLEILTEQF